MLDELKKSVSAILYERMASPFYGTLISTWCIWNWKILYLTVFISESTLKDSKGSIIPKIQYITANYCDPWLLYVYPLISTIVLLTIVPFITHGAYILDLRFSKWRRDSKNEIELSTLLTLKQSMDLRLEMAKQDERFEAIRQEGKLEVEQLEMRNDELMNRIKDLESEMTPQQLTKDGLAAQTEKEEIQKIVSYINDREYRGILTEAFTLVNRRQDPTSVLRRDMQMCNYLVVNKVIKLSDHNDTLFFTEFGKKVLKEIVI